MNQMSSAPGAFVLRRKASVPSDGTTLPLNQPLSRGGGISQVAGGHPWPGPGPLPSTVCVRGRPRHFSDESQKATLRSPASQLPICPPLTGCQGGSLHSLFPP